MSFVDGYGIKGKFTSNTGKKAAQKNKIKESSRKQKAETFRADEKKSLTKSIGTAGPKVRPDGTVKDDKPTAAQKEAFRQQEETYLTKSPGTVGDKYYKNPEGTGTGQGGSGIPKATMTAPVKTLPVTVITPPSYTPVNDNVTYVENTTDTLNPFSLEETEPLTPLSGEDFMAYGSISRTGFGNKINLAQQILYKDWNQVNVNLVYDGLSIKGVKVNVKVPLPFNQKTKFTFGG